jgi:beta-xylosidase
MIGIPVIGTAAIALADDKPKVLFDEKFASPLSAGWHWVREDPNAWKVENGKLMLRSVPGHVDGLKANNARNVLLRQAPVTSHVLILEVFLENQPTTLWEHAGLYCYYDDDNYVCLLKELVREEVQVRMFNEIDGEHTFAGEPRYDAEGVWLRLALKGGKATGYYRQTDKEEWRGMGQLDLPSKGEPKGGLNAGGGPEDAERWVRFSQFRILDQVE